MSEPFVGIKDMSFEDYLQTGDTSKSSLWTLKTKSPAHARVAKEESNAMKIGTAIHCAILEPQAFEERFIRGPDDRRGNKWKDAEVYAAGLQKNLLTSGDYDAALEVRDIAHADAMLRKLVGPKTLREVSAFAIDPKTGLHVRARLDARDDDRALTIDLKTTTDARAETWARRVADFGYHAQDPFYQDVWQMAAQGTNHNPETAAFVFLVFEIKPPFEFMIYELTPNEREAGRRAMREAMDTWAECKRTGVWPGYARGVAPIERPLWVIRNEPDPNPEGEE